MGVDLNPNSISEMESKLENHFIAFSGDISLQKTNEDMIDLAIEKFGKIDILINNTGVIDQAKPLGDMDNKTWDLNINVNLNGPMYASRYFINKKLETDEEGVIVSTSSVGGNAHPTIAGVTYAASKAALIQMTRHTAYFYGKDKIRSNAICGGAVSTTGIAATFTDPHMKGIEASMRINGLSLRDADASEIAQAMLYLASDDASYVNGLF